MINFLKEKIQLDDKDRVLKLHIIIKSFEKGYNLSEADIDSLIELQKTGYNVTFFDNCISKGFFRSKQTVRNAVARMTNLGILSYEKRGERFLNKDFIPDMDNEKVIVQYLISNL